MINQSVWEKITDATNGFLELPPEVKYEGKNVFLGSDGVRYVYGEGGGIIPNPYILVTEHGTIWRVSDGDVPQRIKPRPIEIPQKRNLRAVLEFNPFKTELRLLDEKTHDLYCIYENHKGRPFKASLVPDGKVMIITYATNYGSLRSVYLGDTELKQGDTIYYHHTIYDGVGEFFDALDKLERSEL